MIGILFPSVREVEVGYVWPTLLRDGRLADSDRLAIALQYTTSAGDVCLRDVRRFLISPESREQIAATLNPENFSEFLEQLGRFSGFVSVEKIADLEELCLAVARLVDGKAGVEHESQPQFILCISSYKQAFGVIDALVSVVDKRMGGKVASRVLKDRASVSVASYLLRLSYMEDRSKVTDLSVLASTEDKDELVSAFVRNIVDMAGKGSMANCAHAAHALYTVARLSPDACRDIYQAAGTARRGFDDFVMALLNWGHDSYKGTAFKVKQDVELYAPLERWEELAKERLEDPHLQYPAKAAWLAIATGKVLYAVDGTEKD